jgi:hypothetical protein
MHHRLEEHIGQVIGGIGSIGLQTAYVSMMAWASRWTRAIVELTQAGVVSRPRYRGTTPSRIFQEATVNQLLGFFFGYPSCL